MTTLKHLAEYSGLLLLIQVARWFSLPAIRKTGRLLGRFTYSVLKIRREVVLENLGFAFPEKELSELEAIARQSYESHGVMMMEYLRLPSMKDAEFDEAIQFRDPKSAQAWQQVFDEGRGAVCMTGHFGNWEYLGTKLSRLYPMVTLYQAQSNPLVDAFIRRTRAKAGMESLPRGTALRGILKALRQKKFVAILADQDAGRAGILVDFLGRPASTAKGPAAFVVRTGVPIIFAVSVRQPDGNYAIETDIIRFQFPPEMSEAAKIRQVTEAWSATLEKHIRHYPDHWFWLHRRWKTKVVDQPDAPEFRAGEHNEKQSGVRLKQEN